MIGIAVEGLSSTVGLVVCLLGVGEDSADDELGDLGWYDAETLNGRANILVMLDMLDCIKVSQK